MLKDLAEKLYQDAVNLSEDIQSFRIKLILTQTDYAELLELAKDFDEKKIDWTTCISRMKEITERINKRWNK